MRPRLHGTSLDDYGREVLKRDKFMCKYCGFDGRQFDNWMQLSVDHVMPVSCGGDKKDIDNLVTCCRSCNSITSRMKFDKGTPREEIIRRKKIRIAERRKEFKKAWQEMQFASS